MTAGLTDPATARRLHLILNTIGYHVRTTGFIWGVPPFPRFLEQTKGEADAVGRASGAGLDFDGASDVPAWLAWVPNHSAVEVIIAVVLRRGQRQL